MKSQIEAQTSVYRLRSDGVIVQESKPHIKQTMADARENVAAFAKLADGGKKLLLVDLRELGATEPGVREYYAGPEAGQYCQAMDLVVESQISSMIGNFFIHLNKPPFPCRLFNKLDLAEKWLQDMQGARKAS